MAIFIRYLMGLHIADPTLTGGAAAGKELSVTADRGTIIM
jgi:hypothetical protein